MKYLDCPVIGRRPISEFSVGGVLEPEPEDLGEFTPARWAFERTSLPLVRTEWWFHNPSHCWFQVSRDTATETIHDVVLASHVEA